MSRSHRKKNSARLEDIRHERVRKSQRNNKSERRLDKIRADDQRTALTADKRSGARLLLRNPERHRNESEGKCVVCKLFEENCIYVYDSRCTEQQENKARKDRYRHEALFNKRDLTQ